MEHNHSRTPGPSFRRCGVTVFLATVLLSGPAPAASNTKLVLAVQPVLSQADTRKSFRPMCDYIRKTTGKTVALKTTENYLQYWLDMLSKDVTDLSWDPAFFTDYRIKKYDYTPLVKVKGLASNTLVTRASEAVFESDELVGKSIAAMPPPAPSGIFLSRMFSNPARQPVYIPVENSQRALQMLMDGKVDAAMVPAPMVDAALARGEDILVVAPSAHVPSLQVPHMALSAGPGVDEATRAAITKAFLEADQTESGRAMLKSLGIEGFEPADRAAYDGYLQYLERAFPILK